MWDLPGPGLEPVSPALAGRFLTTTPPGKSNAGRVLRWMLEETEIVVNRFLKVILMRAQKKESCRESFLLLREYLITHEQNVGINMDSKGYFDRVSDGNKE